MPRVCAASAALRFDQLARITGGRMGKHDVACPLCGPGRHAPANRVRKVLRVWNVSPGFLSFHCARCGEHGYAHESGRARRPINPSTFSMVRAAIARREAEESAKRLETARWLWRARTPLRATVGERYLREARGFGGELPATLGFLAPAGGHQPAMIAAFGIPSEPAPGVLAMADDAVRGVHLTRLKPSGLGKDGVGHDKVMIGRSLGAPIVLAPANDLLGLTIAEGIEDALTAHAASGLGAWAAGAAPRLRALVEVVPSWIESVTLLVDDDADGRKHAAKLQHGLVGRGIEVRPNLLPSSQARAAA